MTVNEIDDLVQESIQFGKTLYEELLKSDKTEIHTLTLTCNDLEDVIHENHKSKHPLPQSICASFFKEFDSCDFRMNKKNCLYIFSFDTTKFKPEDIVEAYKKPIASERNRSALKKNPILETNILYVGKVKSNIGGRLATHFGYANPKTGGLQLKYWAKSINLELTVTIITFKDDIGDYLNPLELYLTKKLRPIIGKSK